MKNLKISVISLLSLAFIFLVGCNKKEQTLVKVKGETITTKEFENRLNEVSYFYNPEFLSSEQGKKQILDTVVRETVMLQIAKDKGYDKSEDYKSRLKNFERQTLITELVRNLRDNELKITDEEILQEYQKDQDYYNAPRQLKVAHILVTDKSLADNILAELRNGADFAVLAQSNSIDLSSNENGGELDWFTKGNMVPEFEAAAFDLKNNGDISDVVSSNFGFHIIKKLDERIGEPITFDSIKLNLSRLLERQKFDDWYNQNTQKMNIKVKETLLPQINLGTDESNQ